MPVATVNTPSSAASEAMRMATAVSVVPDVRKAIDRAIQRMNFAGLVCLRPTMKDDTLIAFIHKHFRTGLKPSGAMKADFDFIEKIYNRMKIVFDRSGSADNVWGTSIFDIDRHPTLHNPMRLPIALGQLVHTVQQ